MKSGYNKYTQFPETIHSICVSDMASGSHAHTHDLTAQKASCVSGSLSDPPGPVLLDRSGAWPPQHDAGMETDRAQESKSSADQSARHRHLFQPICAAVRGTAIARQGV